MESYSILVCMFAFLLFNFVVVAHEWGHFITARKFGVRVKEFAVGMGPKVFKMKKGETVYSFRAFPIGGFCAMQGEDSLEASSKDDKTEDIIDPTRSLRSKPAWQKAIIMLAGIFMNFIVGIILSIVLTIFGGPIYSNVIDDLSDSYPEFYASDKFQPGDEIIAINKYKIYVNRDIKYAIRVSNSNECELDIIRNGQHLKVFANLTIGTSDDDKSIEINFVPVDKNLINVVNYAVTDVVSIMRSSVHSLFMLLTGKLSMKNVSGPIGIASSVGKITSENSYGDAIFCVTNMMMAISIGLAVFNAIPFPALDGGRVLFLIPEIFTGKPINAKIEMAVNAIGLIFVFGLTVLVAYSDIKSWGG